jgi:hypothetical protein
LKLRSRRSGKSALHFKQLNIEEVKMKLSKVLIHSVVASITCFGISSVAQASPVTLVGNFVKTAVNDRGTLGSGGTTSPGLLYDKTGTQNFGVNDYLTPGTPWDVFAVKTTQTGIKANNNADPWWQTYNDIAPSSGPTDLSSGTTNKATWSGTYGNYFNIQNTYTFGMNDQRIDVKTTITALSDLTGVQFARAIDPDPDVNTFGSYFTINGRGDAGAGLADANWVHSVGPSTGLPLGLYTTSSVTHNTGVSGGYWSNDPAFYLSGQNDGNGDYAIGLGFDIGSLMAGKTISLDYSYVMGGSLGTVDLPPGPSTVPLPAALPLMLSGLGVLGLAARRRKDVA